MSKDKFDFKVEQAVMETLPKHKDIVSQVSSFIANREAMFLDTYFLIHIKAKPRKMPAFIYNWFIKKFVIISQFKRNDDTI